MSGGKSEPEIFEFIHPADVTDVSATPLSIRLQQALFGGTAMAEVSALEFAHANETLISLTQTKILRVTLPCGLRDGEKVRLPCENANDREIFFHIHIEPEADCRVWGNDIWMTAKLENRLLQRGGEAIVDTPHGPQSIKIDRGIPQGASLCLHGKGLPATETAPAGNLYIRLEAGPDVIRPVRHVLSEFRQRWAS